MLQVPEGEVTLTVEEEVYATQVKRLTVHEDQVVGVELHRTIWVR